MRVLPALEALRDQVRDEILKDPRYLTYQALERSIHNISAAPNGGIPSSPCELTCDDAPRPQAFANGCEESGTVSARVDSEAMANLKHALIDLINRDRGRANGAAPTPRAGEGSWVPTGPSDRPTGPTAPSGPTDR